MVTLQTVLLGAVFLVIGIGVMGIIFPVVPSIPMIWLGIFLYAVLTDFQTLSSQTLVVISALGFAVLLFDYITSILGNKEFEGSVLGVLGGVLGGLVGSLFGPIYTYIVGPVVGSIVIQLLAGKDKVFGIELERFTIVAFIGGTLTKLAAAIAMIGIFLYNILGKG